MNIMSSNLAGDYFGKYNLASSDSQIDLIESVGEIGGWWVDEFNSLENADMKSEYKADSGNIASQYHRSPLAGRDKFGLTVDEVKENCFRDSVAAYLMTSTKLFEAIENALGILQAMASQHALVRKNTSSLHDTCESLLGELQRIQDEVKAMESPLHYYNEISRLGAILGLPVQSEKQGSVNFGGVCPRAPADPDTEEFTSALAAIDECVFFIKEHRMIDSEAYVEAYHVLQAHAFKCIRREVIKVLELTTEQLITAPQLLKEAIDGGADRLEHSAYYTRFKGISGRVKSMVELMEARAGKHGVTAMVIDCHQAYFEQRILLLTPIVTAHIEGLTNISNFRGEHVLQAVRNGSIYMLRVSVLEYQLFVQFFAGPSETVSTRCDERENGIRRMLLEISSILYSYLRPLVIQIDDMDLLCELIHIAKREVMEEHIEPRGVAGEPLGGVIRRFLQDSQEHLIFCAERYLAEEIGGYEPSIEDLNYPERLEGFLHKRAQGDSRALSMYATWYPTLERTLMCLSKLYRNVDMHIFEQIAQEAVSVCTQSLREAAKRLQTRKTELDSDLFLIKNLLTLREQITPFDITFSTREKMLDFSSTTGALSSFLSASNIAGIFSVSSNPLITVLATGLPKISEEQVDTKKNLERELKAACAKFIDSTTNSLIYPLNAFLVKATAVVAASDNSQIRNESFGSPEKISEDLKMLSQIMQTNLPSITAKMSLYLANAETESILFSPVQGNIKESMEKFRSLVDREYSSTEKSTFEATLQSLTVLLSTAVVGTRKT